MYLRMCCPKCCSSELALKEPHELNSFVHAGHFDYPRKMGEILTTLGMDNQPTE